MENPIKYKERKKKCEMKVGNICIVTKEKDNHLRNLVSEVLGIKKFVFSKKGEKKKKEKSEPEPEIPDIL